MIVEELVTVLGLEIRDSGLGQFRQSLSATIGKMGLVVAGAAAAAVAITSMAASAAGDAAKQTRLARALGISTQEMQRLGFAAERAGGSVGGMESMLGGLTTKLLSSKTADGVGFLKDIGNLGLSPFGENGQIKNSVEMLYELADAYANATDKASAYTYIAKILGEDPSLINLFKNGAAGLRAVMSLAPVNSSSDMARLERFDNAKNRAGRVGQQLAVEFGTPMLDAATKAMEALVEWSRSSDFKEIKEDVHAILDAIISSAKKTGEGLQEVAKGLPEGSGKAALLAASGVWLARAHPVVAGIAAAGYMTKDVSDTIDGKEGTLTPQILPGFAAQLDQTISFLQAMAHFLPGTGDAPPRTHIDDYVSKHQGEWAQTIYQTFTFPNITNPKDAGAVIDEARDPDAIRRAAEKGSTGVRK